MPRTYHVPAVARAFRILQVVGEARGGATLADLTYATQLPKTTAFTLVAELLSVGALRFDSARYHLGPQVAHLGGRALDQLDIRAVATPMMEALAAQTTFTVHLGMLHGSDVIFVSKVEGQGFIKFSSYPGMMQAFYLSSLGKAIAAFLPDDELDQLLSAASFVAKTDYTLTDAAAFRRAVASVRAQGYAVEDEENEIGVRCIGAPIFDRKGKATAAVSVTALRSHLPMEAFTQVARDVMACANQISRALGYEPSPQAADPDD